MIYINSYQANQETGKPYRIIKKELRRLFRRYKVLSEEEVIIAIDFFLKQNNLKPDVKLSEFRLRVITRLIKDSFIYKDNELNVFKMTGSNREYSTLNSLILRFNLFLLSLHKKGRIRFQEGFYLYEESNERAIIIPLPWLSRDHPNFLKECVNTIKNNLNNTHKKIYLFKSKSIAVNTMKILMKEEIKLDRNNLFFFSYTESPTRFIQFNLK